MIYLCQPNIWIFLSSLIFKVLCLETGEQLSNPSSLKKTMTTTLKAVLAQIIYRKITELELKTSWTETSFRVNLSPGSAELQTGSLGTVNFSFRILAVCCFIRRGSLCFKWIPSQKADSQGGSYLHYLSHFRHLISPQSQCFISAV